MNDRHVPADTTASDVVIERIFDAPIGVVWRMWTEPAHFAAWYGPTGATIPVAEMDVTVGGRRLICMEMGTPDGVMQMWFVGEYRHVEAPTRLVYTESISDEHGNVSSPPPGATADQPGETDVIVELDDLGDRTRVTLTHRGIPADSPGAMGWNMALDKLTTHLASN